MLESMWLFLIFSCLACSRILLEKKLADADVSEEDQSNLLKFLEKKETEYMRLQRHKMGADDFELLTMIGKGAFGEVNIMGHRFKIHCYSFMAFCLEYGSSYGFFKRINQFSIFSVFNCNAPAQSIY